MTRSVRITRRQAQRAERGRHHEWLYTAHGTRLHRIRSIRWDDDEEIAGHGVACCGIRGRFSMPGFLSRLGRARCATCCRRLGIPLGVGNTLNAGIEERVP